MSPCFEYNKSLAVITQSPKMSGADDHSSFELLGTDGSFRPAGRIAFSDRCMSSMRKPQGPYKAGWQDIALPPQPRFVGDFKELARRDQVRSAAQTFLRSRTAVQETLLRASGS